MPNEADSLARLVLLGQGFRYLAYPVGFVFGAGVGVGLAMMGAARSASPILKAWCHFVLIPAGIVDDSVSRNSELPLYAAFATAAVIGGGIGLLLAWSSNRMVARVFPHDRAKGRKPIPTCPACGIRGTPKHGTACPICGTPGAFPR